MNAKVLLRVILTKENLSTFIKRKTRRSKAIKETKKLNTMHITIFRTLYKHVIDHNLIERMLKRNNLSFERTNYEAGSRYKILSDTEQEISNFKKKLREIYPQIALSA